jgi:meiotic recombination protein SPO11
LGELGINDCIVVQELTPDETMRSIERIIVTAALQILDKRGLSYNVPSRTAANQMYVPELDRIVLRAVNTRLNFTAQSSTKKATIFTRVLELCHKVLRTKIHVTKRDLFYTDVNLFEDQVSCFEKEKKKLWTKAIIKKNWN